MQSWRHWLVGGICIGMILALGACSDSSKEEGSEETSSSSHSSQHKALPQNRLDCYRLTFNNPSIEGADVPYYDQIPAATFNESAEAVQFCRTLD